MTTIAIIDDDVAVREATTSLLQSLGYHTVTFGSAEEFLQSSHRHKVSCIISDVQMPGISGLALQEQLIAERHSAPMILITGFPEKGMRKRALSAGAHGFLVKPFNEQNLISSITSALQRLP